MKVKAIMGFNDLEANTHRDIGDVFEVSEKRAEFLLKNNAIEIIEEVKEEVLQEEQVEEVIEEPIEVQEEVLEVKPKKKKK